MELPSDREYYSAKYCWLTTQIYPKLQGSSGLGLEWTTDRNWQVRYLQNCHC